MDRHSIDTTTLQEAGAALRVVDVEFNGANAGSDTAAGAVGHDVLAEHVREFAHDWDDRRQKMVDGIGHLAEVAIGVGDAFDQLERSGQHRYRGATRWSRTPSPCVSRWTTPLVPWPQPRTPRRTCERRRPNPPQDARTHFGPGMPHCGRLNVLVNIAGKSYVDYWVVPIEDNGAYHCVMATPLVSHEDAMVDLFDTVISTARVTG